MSNYLRPDVYVEELNTGEKPIASASTSIGAFVGVTARGKVGEPVLCNNWSDFVKNFAYGLPSPFMRDSNLALAVYGFFKNGGSNCYVVRVPIGSMKKATAELESNITVNARDEGTWGNKIKVHIEEYSPESYKRKPKAKKGEGAIATVSEATDFKVTVKYNEEVVEVFEPVTNDKESPNYYGELINNNSKYIFIETDSKLQAGEETPLASGAYTVSSVNDGNYTGAQGLEALDKVDVVNMIAVPGVTTPAVLKATIDYATGRGDCFAILDAPVSNETDVSGLLEAREPLAGNGAFYHPWGKIVDPLSKNGSLRNCPPSGHVMGVYARTDSKRGVYKAPAGEEASILGFVSLCAKVGASEMDMLNPQGVNCIVAKPNKGIVIWGARTLNPDTSKRYVSDIRYDIMIRESLYNGIQWALFEPNDEVLLDRVTTSLASFLDLQWRSGALLGSSPEEAYYVKCDTELNDETARNNGQLIAEIGYAKKKPAEFVIIRIVQKSQSE